MTRTDIVHILVSVYQPDVPLAICSTEMGAKRWAERHHGVTLNSWQKKGKDGRHSWVSGIWVIARWELDDASEGN